MKHLFALILLLFIFSSCSSYSKIVKGDNYDAKFKLANDMFDKKKWTKCLTLYEQVYQRLPKTAEGELSYYRLGKVYYAMGDFYMAGYHFGSFFEKYPYSTKTEEAFFLKAICSVKNSPEYSMDQQETQVALNEMQQFIYLFPKSNRIDTVNIIMDNLRSKIEKKDYENVKLYSKTLNYRSAVVTSKTFVSDYPRSKYKEEIYYIWLKNAHLLAIYSVNDKKKERFEDFLETYRNFVVQFPASKYLSEINSLNASVEKELAILTNSK